MQTTKTTTESKQPLLDYLIECNNEVREYLRKKNDVGQLDMKTDPIQSLSFMRGKNAAFATAIPKARETQNIINILSEALEKIAECEGGKLDAKDAAGFIKIAKEALSRIS